MTAMPLKLTGELNIYAAAEMQQTVQKALLEAGDVAIDLAEVTELDSAGVQQLLLLHRECQHAGRGVSLVASSPAADEVLNLLGLQKLFTA